MKKRVGKRIEKLQIMVADSELAMIDNWQFENRFPNRSAAIRALILLGVEYARVRPEAAEDVLNNVR